MQNTIAPTHLTGKPAEQFLTRLLANKSTWTERKNKLCGWYFETETRRWVVFDNTKGHSWVDNSWHNDIYPRFQTNGLCLWIAPDNIDEREATEHKKYMLMAADSDGEPLHRVLLHSDSEEELLNFINTYNQSKC